MDKLKVNVYMGLPIIRSMIKDSALHKEIGVGASWLNQKIRRKEECKRAKGFTEGDIKLINSAIESFSTQIRGHFINDSMTHEEITAHLNEVCRLIPAKYIFSQMGKNKDWWDYNVCGQPVKEITSEDILLINLIILDVANRLYFIELSL